ncbi:MAG TPA: GspH/FimT family pseudopilin [Gammaproteobacteria bacterium]|nr:GspH/FimT family pseudopilin [Gammaproteobacteria bacterium]
MKTDARHSRGFTVIELVAVIIIVGILAAFVVPRFAGRAAFDARGVYDNLAGALRYAQKKALASNCPVKVTITATSYSLTHSPAPCGSGTGAPVLSPAGGGEAFASSDLHGVTLSPATTITFLASGATVAGSDVTISVIGAGQTRTLTVIGETGYVSAQ